MRTSKHDFPKKEKIISFIFFLKIYAIIRRIVTTFSIQRRHIAFYFFDSLIYAVVVIRSNVSPYNVIYL